MKVRVLFVVLVLFGSLVPAVPASSQIRCTKSGTKKSETLSGTEGRDVLCGKGGNDRIFGKGGNDIILGGGGNDYITGSDGNEDRKSTRLNSSHANISYAVFCLKKKK